MVYRFSRPLLFLAPPETAHKATLYGLKHLQDILPPPRQDDWRLATSAGGLKFSNPIGLAAGFDKNAEVVQAMLKLGFGFSEVGSLTPHPQMGNPKPRIFRLPQEEAVINRLGLNNEGQAAAYQRLEKLGSDKAGVIGVNLAANTKSDDVIADYVAGVETFSGLADYLTLNVSCPNIPGKSAVPDIGQIRDILNAIEPVRGQTDIYLKISPDIDPQHIGKLVQTIRQKNLAGIIVGNTSTQHEAVQHLPHGHQQGGLSGAPLMQPSTHLLTEFYRHTQGEITLIGTGGIRSGADIYQKIRAGANLVQLYTALIYQGPFLLTRLKKELLELLDYDGFTHIQEAVGADMTKTPPKIKPLKKRRRAMSLKIYHNPRCSKSRQTLALIEESGAKVEIIEYLKTPLQQKEINELLAMLKCSARDIMRVKENIYKELGLKDVTTEAKLIAALAANPILLERPIVVKGKKAIICRPPELVIPFL